MKALVLAAALALQDGATLFDWDWMLLASSRGEALHAAPSSERAPLVLELERMFDEFGERVERPGARLMTLREGAWFVCSALADVEEDLLAGRSRDEWIDTACALALEAGNVGMIAASYRRRAAELRDAGEVEAALDALAEGRDLLGAPPEPAGGAQGERASAAFALAEARLLGEEGELERLLGHYDDALRGLDAAEAALDEAERATAAELDLRAGSDPGGRLASQRGQAEALRARVLGRRFELCLELGLREPALLTQLAEARLAERTGRAEDLANALAHAAHLAIYYSDDPAEAEALCAGAEGEAWYSRLEPRDRANLTWLRAKARDLREWLDPSLPPEARGMLVDVIASGLLRGVEELYARCTLAQVYLRAGELEAASAELAGARALLAREVARGGPLVHLMQAHWLTALEGRLALARGAPLEELEEARERLAGVTTRVLAQWADVQVRPGGIGFVHHGRRNGSLAVLLELTLASSDPQKAGEAALRPLLEALAHGSLSRWFLAPGEEPIAPALAEIRGELIGERGGMLAYLVAEEKGYVFAVDRGSVRVASLAAEHELARLRELLAVQLEGPPPRENRPPGRLERALVEARRALGEALVPAELRAQVLGWDELVVCGFSGIGHVPFEALEIEGRVLGDELALSYLATPTLGARLLERERRRPRVERDGLELLLLVSPGSGELLGSSSKRPLPWRDELERSLSAPYASYRVLSDDDACLPRLAAVLQEVSPSVLHLVAHGLAGRELEANRELLLAAVGGHDGRADHADLRGLDAPAVVVVSACGAGQGRPRHGDDGVDDLGGALLIAGAGAVVLSADDLHFEATMALMAPFHRELAAGASPAWALFTARRELARHPEYSHPYFRSLVHVIGLGGRPLER